MSHPSRTSQAILTKCSNINHLGLLSLGFSNPDTVQGANKSPKESWLVLTYGSWGYVSLERCLLVLRTDSRRVKYWLIVARTDSFKLSKRNQRSHMCDLPKGKSRKYSCTDTWKKGLSIPNWYWRTWEVLFGVVAACVPTLMPLYKWIGQEYTRLRSENRQSKPSHPDQRSAPKPSKATLPKTHGARVDGGMPREEDMLPLQNFDSVGNSENVEREVKQQQHDTPGTKLSESPPADFKPGLHLHGDLSTSRPGHFKRWDSEARIGGGHGVEEIEDRI